jgi:hypothetical protein
MTELEGPLAQRSGNDRNSYWVTTFCLCFSSFWILAVYHGQGDSRGGLKMQLTFSRLGGRKFPAKPAFLLE